MDRQQQQQQLNLITLFLFLPAILIFLFSSVPAGAAAAFAPQDNYLLACGAANATALPDGRIFLPDSPAHRSSAVFSSSSSSFPLRRSACLFLRQGSYSFAISSKGPHVLRLHFYPFPASSRNLSDALFNVSAAGFPLLTHFSAPAPTLKEFFLDVDLPTLDVALTPSSPRSFAFLNALELFSLPAGLVPDSATPVAGSLATDGRLSAQVFETLHRINVGGPTVTPTNDTLWRTWLPDGPFFRPGAVAQVVAFSGRINYQDGGATPETAPESVYGTARVMYAAGSNNSNRSNSSRFNLSWDYPVPSSAHGYLLRMHFCDIVSESLNELYFDVYIDGYLAYKDFDLSAQAGYSLASPYFVDFLIGPSGGSRSIRVSVGPSDRSLPSKINAILNGLEVMKIDGVASFTEYAKKKHHIGLVIGLVLGGLALLCAVFALVIVLLHCRRRTKEPPPSQEAVAWSPVPAFTANSYSRLAELTTSNANASPVTNFNLQLKMPLSEILLATNNFDEHSLIGSGGFGKVYRGVIRDGTNVAVKRAARGSRQGIGEFQTEIVVLSKIRHRHLVSLIGYCEEQSEMVLVYEFMEKGPLRDHLYGSGDHPPLSWKQRLEICIGAARGLHYLHTGSAQGIIHRDVKSSNILLAESYDAKVADFGLSRLGSQNQNHVSTGVKGSFGYLDPEYFKTQQLTDKSDVYSFGVVLLEALCARPAIDSSLPWDEVNLAEWGMKWQKRGHLERIVDPSLKGEMDANSLRKFGETAEKCLAPYGVDRPTMGEVLWNLEYVLQLHETAVHREPHEDSRNGLSDVSLQTVRLPPLSRNVTHEQNSQVTSQTFSQLITNEGR